MANFKPFKIAVENQFQFMSSGNMFHANIDKDEMWDIYLKSFPEGTNPIYRERTEHDCNCCKQFIRGAGGVVSIVNNKLVSIWDIQINDGVYQVVADALSAYVKSKAIADVYLYFQADVGVDHNHEIKEGNSPVRWDHLHYKLPAKCVKPNADIPSKLSDLRATKEVFKRGLDELTIDSLNTVLELIDQNSLYRGEEHKSSVSTMQKHKLAYDKLSTECKDNYAWEQSITLGGLARIRNTAMGTLLIDLSEGMDLDKAVRKFEAMVAPTNYKRPTALITKSMIENAQKVITDLGLTDALPRRYAVAGDLTINNVLFADRSVKPAMNVFDELAANTKEKSKKLDKVEEISIDDFIKNVLPKAESIELLFENKHANNLMSLIAPVHADAGSLFKWGNNFSWAYNGDIADSIKEKVKNAGGAVDGDLRCSLSWFNFDDLDLHLVEPRGETISFRNCRSSAGGTLDVDMNAGSGTSREPVENITYADKKKMKVGTYQLIVHNFRRRETTNVGFDVEIEFGGEILNFHYDKAVKDSEQILVAEFSYDHTKGLKIINSLPSSKSSKQLFGIGTEQFHKVKMVMNSPNHWDGEETGNKHTFFILDKCVNEGQARGFFNEFLKGEFNEHRKVFEIIGAKMKTEPSNEQLSGIGFSSTQRNQVVVKVTGSFSRTLKINI